MTQDTDPPGGMRRGLTSYGDRGFSLFLRKAFIKGTMHDGDRLCAELDGLFIRLNPGQP